LTIRRVEPDRWFAEAPYEFGGQLDSLDRVPRRPCASAANPDRRRRSPSRRRTARSHIARHFVEPENTNTRAANGAPSMYK
jgi:hypothetical protein